MNVNANSPTKAFEGLQTSFDGFNPELSNNGGDEEIPEEMIELMGSTLFVIFSNMITAEKPPDPPMDMEHTPVF